MQGNPHSRIKKFLLVESGILSFGTSRTISLQCRRILGGRNHVRVRNIAVAAIFDFMTVEDWGE